MTLLSVSLAKSDGEVNEKGQRALCDSYCNRKASHQTLLNMMIESKVKKI